MPLWPPPCSLPFLPHTEVTPRHNGVPTYRLPTAKPLEGHAAPACTAELTQTRPPRGSSSLPSCLVPPVLPRPCRPGGLCPSPPPTRGRMSRGAEWTPRHCVHRGAREATAQDGWVTLGHSETPDRENREAPTCWNWPSETPSR